MVQEDQSRSEVEEQSRNRVVSWNLVGASDHKLRDAHRHVSQCSASEGDQKIRRVAKMGPACNLGHAGAVRCVHWIVQFLNNIVVSLMRKIVLRKIIVCEILS